ncbi:hypothetical protein IFM89_017402 [Coptis chinensis]|uniref:cyclin-dependent kinase n=1 Tax=Coptis chinensis TaxID=261450 RepID=A0A835HMT7_9MAGN|nr:hypothetical protein IFM89_017402 [Coptis chinensis]
MAAAGKHSSYRHNEFKNHRESNFVVSLRRKENDDYYYERRDEGGRYSSSKIRGNDRKREVGRRRVVKREERELGEVYSGSGSDGAVEVPSPPVKKRKFLPIVWDIIKGEKKLEKGGVVSSGTPLSGVSSLVNDMEEGEVIPVKNVSGSRWVDKDEGEVSDNDDEMAKKVHSGHSVTILSTTVLSPPELGELTDLHVSGGECRVNENNDMEEEDEDDEDYKVNCDAEGTELEGVSNSPGSFGSMGQPQRIVNMLNSCRSVHEFERLNKINSGTYGVVFRARDKRSGEIVALKKVIKNDRDREGFPVTFLREINILLSLCHPSVVNIKEVVVEDERDETFVVMEYMEHDLRALLETKEQPFTQSEVKCLMRQLLEGMKHLHDNWVLHRDLKTTNILLNNRGELKICDFGLSRQYGSPLKPYTPLVVTLSYRAPELLLGAEKYSTAIDMWSIGCIMAELLDGKPLFIDENKKKPRFTAESEIEQLKMIFGTLGRPDETIWPGFSRLPGVKINVPVKKYKTPRERFPSPSFFTFTSRPYLSEAGLDLLNRLVAYDPEKRITAQDALNHEWFREVPLPKDKGFMSPFHTQRKSARY